eukprot:CAMPEP_0197694990 /NCGR_PEP_ID=MMETSP1338-20131121/114596_1 /TAXON_ID=43686 ORGANISM="Pelagodinium beii, Strain RCC1491" /NCGR_SAMPLE_ID=MMETSP1338 /ASSEMBLY_ACC=CAM_ASM_000754 /LENGTH=157 /DNA_ID=CAMNT_0043277909 /DNA_START=40 /DNA_END=517 /DNA_ORIENTATION=-
MPCLHRPQAQGGGRHVHERQGYADKRWGVALEVVGPPRAFVEAARHLRGGRGGGDASPLREPACVQPDQWRACCSGSAGTCCMWPPAPHPRHSSVTRAASRCAHRSTQPRVQHALGALQTRDHEPTGGTVRLASTALRSSHTVFKSSKRSPLALSTP